MGLEYWYLLLVVCLFEEVWVGIVGMVCMVVVREHWFLFLIKVGDWNWFMVNIGWCVGYYFASCCGGCDGCWVH